MDVQECVTNANREQSFTSPTGKKSLGGVQFQPACVRNREKHLDAVVYVHAYNIWVNLIDWLLQQQQKSAE